MIPIYADKTQTVLHPDRNISPAEFRSLGSMGKLHVTRIFRTIQGEGPYTGHPAVFVRVSGCNIGKKEDCPWCDTEFSLQKGAVLSVEAVRDQIRALLPPGGNLVVITGGEPLLQWPALYRLMELMDDKDAEPLTFQFETNGMYLTDEMLLAANGFSQPVIQFVVSPKIPHSHGRYAPLRSFMFERRAKWMVYLKYVVSGDEDSPYNELPPDVLHRAQHGEPLPVVYVSGMTAYDGVEAMRRGEHSNYPPSIWQLSPEARSTTAENYQYAARLALTYGFRLSYQTHLLAGLE